jgi:hypothetical protein
MKMAMKLLVPKKMLVIFQVLTAASMKMTIFRDTTPCSLVKADRRFRSVNRQTSPTTRENRPDGGGNKHLRIVCSYFYETAGLNIPEGCNIQVIY